MDNWTGILGSVIMVMGAAFLSIYAALKMAPFYRFLMLCAFSGALFSIYCALRAKAKWLKLGHMAAQQRLRRVSLRVPGFRRHPGFKMD